MMKIELGSTLPEEVRQLLQKHLSRKDVFSIEGITHNVANNLRYSDQLVITERNRDYVKEMLKTAMVNIKSSVKDTKRIEIYINQLD